VGDKPVTQHSPPLQARRAAPAQEPRKAQSPAPADLTPAPVSGTRSREGVKARSSFRAGLGKLMSSGFSGVFGGAYAGDIPCLEGWDILQADQSAILIDVRTQAEWTFVGLPDLSGLGRKPMLLEWQSFPEARQNDRFTDYLSDALGGTPDDRPLLFLCRSGARSRSAAIAATAAGWGRAYNLADGFEGGLNAEGRRGLLSGWKASGLPWVQT